MSSRWQTPSTSWYKILVQAGEADRLSAKVTMRAVARANRLSLMEEEELPRKCFDAAWSAPGDSVGCGPPSWAASVQSIMGDLGITLARDALGAGSLGSGHS